MLKVRLLQLDGLKGICAVAVFISHYSLTLYKVSPDWTYSYFSRSFFLWFEGDTAVNVFILVSSLLSLISLERKPADEILLKRYLRIMLPVAVILLIMGVANALGLLYNSELGHLSNNDWLTTDSLTYNGLKEAIFCSPLGIHHEWLNVLWMLGYIFLGTIISIILHICLKNVRLLKLLFVLFFFAIVCKYYNMYYANVLWAYLLYRYINSTHKSYKNDFSISILSLFLLLYTEFLPKEEIYEVLRAICLVNITMFFSFFSKMLSSRFFTWLGKYSMEIYILQLPIFYTISSYLWLKTQDMFINSIATISATVFLSIAFQKIVSKNCDIISNRIVKWLKQ